MEQNQRYHIYSHEMDCANGEYVVFSETEDESLAKSSRTELVLKPICSVFLPEDKKVDLVRVVMNFKGTEENLKNEIRLLSA